MERKQQIYQAAATLPVTTSGDAREKNRTVLVLGVLVVIRRRDEKRQPSSQLGQGNRNGCGNIPPHRSHFIDVHTPTKDIYPQVEENPRASYQFKGDIVTVLFVLGRVVSFPHKIATFLPPPEVARKRRCEGLWYFQNGFPRVFAAFPTSKPEP